MLRIFLPLLTTIVLSSSLHSDTDAFDIYDWMETLSGKWTLSSADKQLGTSSYKSEALKSLVGTQKNGMVFKSIGRESTIQEDLLPDTAKQMVTMYHCKDLECNNLKATHYCVKQNQPEFIANLQLSTPTRIVFDCDMSTAICQSDEDHVHTIIHEITENGQHLKSSYLSFEDKKPKEISSIYHFDRKKN